MNHCARPRLLAAPVAARAALHTTLAAGLALALAGLAPRAHAQANPMPAASAASAASGAAVGNKAAKPPVEAAASRAGVATK